MLSVMIASYIMIEAITFLQARVKGA